MDGNEKPREIRARARQEVVKRSFLEQKSQKEIAEALHVSPRTVQRDLAETRREMKRQICADLPKIVYTSKDSYNYRKWLLAEARKILRSPPRKGKDRKPIDDRPLKLKAIEVISRILADLDQLFGVYDVNQWIVMEEIGRRLKVIDKENKSGSEEKPAEDQVPPHDTEDSKAA